MLACRLLYRFRPTPMLGEPNGYYLDGVHLDGVHYPFDRMFMGPTREDAVANLAVLNDRRRSLGLPPFAMVA